ncbi:acyl carrier protein [Endozoicomonas sp. Mp262]|uniref:acyl carrier protein n=1 Tax=Endozoicomonas sp. Mp262 TaxID=2919499 RepID=UPI0021E0214E
MTKNDILAALKEILVDNFEVEPGAITPDARLYQDLDLDSIDAVDLVVALQGLTGKKIKPEEFKAVRTVADVVDATYSLLEAA